MPSMTGRRAFGVVARALCVALGLVLIPAAAYAQIYRPLHSFDVGEGSNTAGPLTQAGDGLFYGANRSGGAFDQGTLFRMNPNGTVVVLHSFAGGTDGSRPGAQLIVGRDGNLYGTTLEGGPANRGVVFRMTPAGDVAVLHAFDGAPDDGSTPGSLVQTAGGDFYGTTCGGGANDGGTVYRMTEAGAVTPLYSFTDAADGRCPGGLLEAKDGNLYGTASGGVLANGLAFRLTTGGTFSNVHDFVRAVDGGSPGALVQSTFDGQFYGVANNGGPTGYGTVFRLTASGTTSVMHAFGGGQYDGIFPVGRLVEGTDGQFYGVTEYGGLPYSYYTTTGTVYRLTRGGVYTVLRRFRAEPDGFNPRTGLIQGSDGHLYGTATGGFNSLGMIFRLETYICTNTIEATYTAPFQSLNFVFRFQSPAPGTWTVWAISSAGITPLWSAPIGAVSLPWGFGVGYNVAPAGPVLFVTMLDVPGYGSCGGWSFVDTGP